MIALASVADAPPRDSLPALPDTGERERFASGMQRDTTKGKVKYLLTRDGPMYERWARHLTAGAEKYDDRNWMQANSQEELERFRESAVRHFEQWLRGDTDEDHASAVFFNINGAEYVSDRMREEEGGAFGDPSGRRIRPYAPY